MVVGTENLLPEITVTIDGVYWHPLASPSSADMLVAREIFPLQTAVSCVQERLAAPLPDAAEELVEFT